MPDDVTDEALAAARRALAARHESPVDALSAAQAVLARPDVTDRATVVAHWARGLAERELNHLEDSEVHLRASVEIAHTLDDPALAAQVSSALVPVLAARGRADEALELADSIRDALPARDLADLDMKRALVFEQMGRFTDALEAYTTALEPIVAGDDRVLEARLRCNRAIVLAYQGRTSEALADSVLAEELARAAGQYFLAGGAAHNHGFISGLRGDIVAGLTSFARADEWYARVGHPGRSAGVLASDRCELMLAAGLHDEARASAEQSVESLIGMDDVSDLAEARLLLARACLAQGDLVGAQREATGARAAFQSAGRSGWAAIAEFIGLHASFGSELRWDADVAARTGQIVTDLDLLGWTAEASSVRVAAAEIAIQHGDLPFARHQLGAAAHARRTGRADRRADAWLATAYLRRVDDDAVGAKRAAAAGLRVVAEHQATLGATDLRVGATNHAGRLARCGLELAVAGGRPRDVLLWAERVRANALAMPAMRPPSDSPLADALADLRRLRGELDESRREGSPDGELDVEVRRQERAVRDLARMVGGSSPAQVTLSIPELQERLGAGRTLIEYVDVNDSLLAVVVTDRRCRLVRLGPSTEIASLVDQAMFAASRLARTGGSDASRAASVEALTDSFSQLDRLLVTPLRLATDNTVIVPTGVLHSVPWGGLPSIAGQPHAIASSARRWRPDDRSVRDQTAVAVITGPGLEHPAAEVDAVMASHPHASQLVGPAATVGASIALLGVTGIAHIACHGHFRSDSPMFSSLALADGPVTVYDLESVGAPPAVVVLPACNAGLAAVSVGDELIGTASALLGVGVAHVVAPVTIVNDLATVEVMRSFHRHLRAGCTPATALAHTRADIAAADDISAWAAATSLLCLE